MFHRRYRGVHRPHVTWPVFIVRSATVAVGLYGAYMITFAGVATLVMQ